MRAFLLLFIALSLAGGAAWIANSWIQSQSSNAVAVKQELVSVSPVVIAATEITFGSKLEKPQLKIIEWPKSSLPDGAFQDVDKLVGKIVTRRFVENEVFLNQNVREHLGGSTLSALIAVGLRAMSVRVNDVAGVAGFILPGNRVDILSTQQQRGNQRKEITRTLLRNVKVLAVDQEASPNKEKPAVVRALTLEVTPKQAEILVNASKKGSLQFTLINPTDNITKPERKKQKSRTKSVRVRNPRYPVKTFSWQTEKLKLCKSKFC